MNDHKFQLGHSNHAWLCLDLLEVLCQLAERGHANSVRSILEHPLKHSPEILLLGLSHINVLILKVKTQCILGISLFSVLTLINNLVILNADGV